jgi:hypothetical protein
VSLAKFGWDPDAHRRKPVARAKATSKQAANKKIVRKKPARKKAAARTRC